MDTGTILAIVGLLIGLPTAVAALVGFFKMASFKGRMDLLEAENERVRAEAGDLRDQTAHLMATLNHERDEHERREKEHMTRIARLEENINVLQGSLIKEFLEAVRAAMVDAFNEVIHTGDRRRGNGG